MTLSIKTAAFAFAAGGLALATPAAAEPISQNYNWNQTPAYGEMSYDHSRHHHRDYYRGRGHYDDRYDRYDRDDRYDRGYGEPVYRNTRVWRGNDGRTYCRRSDGTTGLIVGAAGGALLGREVAGRRGDRTLGAILGGVAGALLGKSLDDGVRCR